MSLGRVQYGKQSLPITRIEVHTGKLWVHASRLVPVGETETIDENDGFSIFGSDGTLIFAIGRRGPEKILTAKDGGMLEAHIPIEMTP